MKTLNYRGFTLLESLLVLLCVTVSLIVPLIYLKNWRDQTEVVLFFNQLERDIQRTHQSAIIEGRECSIDQENNQNQLRFKYFHHGKVKIECLKVEEPLKLRSSEPIKFNKGTGNVKKLETIKIEDHLNNQAVLYKFQLGSGKVIRSEESL